MWYVISRTMGLSIALGLFGLLCGVLLISNSHCGGPACAGLVAIPLVYGALGLGVGAGVGLLLFGLRRRKPIQGLFSDLPEPAWLEAESSPLGRRVVDCRGISHLWASPAECDVEDRFAKTCGLAPSSLAGVLPPEADPAGHEVDWRFDAAELPRLLAGFVPDDPGERWRIVHEEGRLYFLRSWTGSLVFVAALDVDGPAVTRVWLAPGKASGTRLPLTLALCRYLIDSHLLRRPAAVPVPEDLCGDPGRMAAFAYSFAGRRGDFAEPFWRAER